MDTRSRNEEIRRRVANGETQQQVADYYGVSRQRIHQIVGDLSRDNPELRDKRRAERYKALVEEGFTQKEIAFVDGVSRGSVRRILHKYGLKKETGPLKKETHGNISCYKNGCRCDLCRAANTEEHRHFKGMGVNFTHGTETGYVNHMCRCPLCKKAGSEANKRNRAKRKAREGK